MKEQIITTVFSGVGCEQQAAETISDETQNYDLVFTTSPRLLNASVQAALAIPKANILNCSLNTSHPSVRTYYARIYEAKFLMGVIAGCQTYRIGYVADYPIHGIISSKARPALYEYKISVTHL
ncbi:MAG: hypothetical protein PUK75_08450 [bacterium]|nr:hypothetical protein [bacterium]MDY4100499.1 hypothetical protein [Lachnospiraceae bacterium]